MPNTRILFKRPYVHANDCWNLGKKHDLSAHKLSQYATDAPHINSSCVFRGGEHHLGNPKIENRVAKLWGCFVGILSETDLHKRQEVWEWFVETCNQLFCLIHGCFSPPTSISNIPDNINILSPRASGARYHRVPTYSVRSHSSSSRSKPARPVEATEAQWLKSLRNSLLEQSHNHSHTFPHPPKHPKKNDNYWECDWSWVRNWNMLKQIPELCLNKFLPRARPKSQILDGSSLRAHSIRKCSNKLRNQKNIVYISI